MGAIVDPQEIKKILLARDKKVFGGVDCILVGEPGCGKTTGLAQIALINKTRYNDVIIWRGSHDCQWAMLLNRGPRVVFWLKAGMSYKLMDRKAEKIIQLSDIVEVKRWDTVPYLINNLEKDAINIIETTPYTPKDPPQHLQFCREWIEIWDELTHRLWSQPVSIFFDEFEDLVPEGVGKDFWDAELAFSGIIRACRKNDISSFMATHSLEEVHWRVKKKIRWRIYMRGSKPDSNSAINKTKHLNMGEAFIEGTNFEKFSFSGMGEDLKLRAIITVDKKV